MSKRQRLFFALWPDEATREAVVSATRACVLASGGRAIPARNLHATLAFLGEIPEDRISAVNTAGASLRGEPFELGLESIDTWRRAETLVLSARTVPQALLDLIARLRHGLNDAGFAAEERPFRFHVTLARKVKAAQMSELMPPLSWRVEDFVLVRSELSRAGSEYSVMARWPLENKTLL